MKNQKIIKICEQKFIYLNYSPKTKSNYISYISKFLDGHSNVKTTEIYTHVSKNILSKVNLPI